MNRFLMNVSMASGVLLLSSLSGDQKAIAQGTMVAEPIMGTRCFAMDPEPYAFLETVEKNLVTSIVPSTNATIRGVVKPNSSPENLSIIQSSGNAQFDAECLEAVLSSTRTDSNSMTLYGVWILSHDLPNARQLRIQRNIENQITIFRVPVSVLRRYPGIFSEEELLNKDNLRPLHNQASRKTTELTQSQIDEISAYFSQWNEFFKQTPTATKAQILSEANLLEEKSKKYRD